MTRDMLPAPLPVLPHPIPHTISFLSSFLPPIFPSFHTCLFIERLACATHQSSPGSVVSFPGSQRSGPRIIQPDWSFVDFLGPHQHGNDLQTDSLLDASTSLYTEFLSGIMRGMILYINGGGLNHYL